MDNRESYTYDYGTDQESTRGGGFMIGTLAGAAVASALVYLLDPQSGRQRRAMVRERAGSAYQKSRQGISSARQTIGTRARDVSSRGRERWQEMRSQSGASTGSSSYGGPTSGGYDAGTSGYDTGSYGSSSEYGMQGSSMQRRGAGSWMQGMQGGGQGTRVATGAAGLGLAGWGLSRRGPLGIALSALGIYMLVQTMRQQQGRMIGSGLEVDETIEIDAPVAEVWERVRRVESWPQFMTHVQEIAPQGDRRHHWRVDGPAGVATEWDSEITEEVPNERIGWRTMPGSMVDSEGVLHLESVGSDRTRIHVHMLYNPPAGAAGHVVAKLFRRDPHQQMREDLQNLKRTIEQRTGGLQTGGTGLQTGATH